MARRADDIGTRREPRTEVLEEALLDRTCSRAYEHRSAMPAFGATAVQGWGL